VDSVAARGYMTAMVRPNLPKWSLSLSSLAQLSVEAAHPRTRERLMALVLLAQEAPNRLCATRLSQVLGRNVHTVLKWVHDFNARGPTALIYRRTGGTQAQADTFTPLLHEALEQARAQAAQPVIKKRRSRC